MATFCRRRAQAGLITVQLLCVAPMMAPVLSAQEGLDQYTSALLHATAAAPQKRTAWPEEYFARSFVRSLALCALGRKSRLECQQPAPPLTLCSVLAKSNINGGEFRRLLAGQGEASAQRKPASGSLPRCAVSSRARVSILQCALRKETARDAERTENTDVHEKVTSTTSWR